MRRKTSKAAEAWLKKMVVAFVYEHAGSWERPNDPAAGLVLPTKVGLLHVSPYDDWIACQFDDVQAACNHFGVKYGEIFGCHRLSGYTGKWNFHTSDGRSKSMDCVTVLFEGWKREVEQLLVSGAGR